MRKEIEMTSKHCTMLALAISLLPGLVQAAEDAATLAKSNGCLACHHVAVKKVGPAYKAVAKKYKGDAGAAAHLFQKVRQGGKGAWGPVPMPPQTGVSDADLKAIIAWVLEQ